MNNNKSQLRAGIILNYFNLIIGNLIPIFYTPVMLRLLGQSEYGLYKLSNSITSYLSLISLGIGSAVTRYLIKARQEEGQEAEEQFLGLFMIIFQCIAIASFIVGCIITLNLDLWYSNSLTATELVRMKILVFILVCNTALNFSLSPYISVVNTHEKFIFMQLMNILTTCFGPILNLIVLFLGYASIGMAISTLILGIVSRAIYLIYIRRCLNIRARYNSMPLHLLKEILKFSFWVFVANVVTQLYNATDTVMIGAVASLGTVGVAVYNVGATFNSMVFSLTTGVSNLLGPKTNRMVFSNASNTELTDLAIKVGRIQGYIISLIVSGFIVFGKGFISFYAGDGYQEAYWVAVLMMVPNMIPLVQSVCLSIIVARNQHKFRSIVYLFIAIFNVVATWIMMKYLGIIGAALATGIAVVIGQGFAMNWFYSVKSGLEIKRFWKEVGKVYIVPIILCGAGLLIGKFVDLYNVKIMLVGIIGYTLVFCGITWLVIFNDYEKTLISGPLKKIIKA